MIGPMSMRTVENDIYFVFAKDVVEPMLLTVFEGMPARMLAVRYRWRSWKWQRLRFGANPLERLLQFYIRCTM